MNIRVACGMTFMPAVLVFSVLTMRDVSAAAKTQQTVDVDEWTEMPLDIDGYYDLAMKSTSLKECAMQALGLHGEVRGDGDAIINSIVSSGSAEQVLSMARSALGNDYLPLAALNDKSIDTQGKVRIALFAMGMRGMGSKDATPREQMLSALAIATAMRAIALPHESECPVDQQYLDDLERLVAFREGRLETSGRVDSGAKTEDNSKVKFAGRRISPKATNESDPTAIIGKEDVMSALTGEKPQCRQGRLDVQYLGEHRFQSGDIVISLQQLAEQIVQARKAGEISCLTISAARYDRNAFRAIREQAVDSTNISVWWITPKSD
jgi:hypothetical protein